MKADHALDRLADLFGIVGEFLDLAGVVQKTSPDTKLALLRANGVSVDSPAMAREALDDRIASMRTRQMPEEIICTPGKKLQVQIPPDTHWEIIAEGSEKVLAQGRSRDLAIKDHLPSGIHRLVTKSGSAEEITRLICAPQHAPGLPIHNGQNRLWGINCALYGLHSTQGPAVGNYIDLSKAARACADRGADFLGINPVHAMGWNNPEIISPYSPSHRGFLNTAHLAVDPPGIGSRAAHQARLHLNQASRSGSQVDYQSSAAVLRPLLEAQFVDFVKAGNSKLERAFRKFCRDSGPALERFSRFEALSDEHGPDWTLWPENAELDYPTAALSCGGSIQTRPYFHAWLQWTADRQLAQAQSRCIEGGMALGLYLDLAVGPRRNGAEAWCEQESIAEGVSLGAPPDHLSPAGQNWNLAAFAPGKLASNNYDAFRMILRQTMKHCGMIRIDHVLGLNRSFWIPGDGSRGGYIKQNFDALLAVVCMEAENTDTVVVGEDLGLVPHGFRETMNERNIYSYSVLQYEKNDQDAIKPVEELQQQALVCFGTHDTPTLAGFMQERDIDWWYDLGWIDAKQASSIRNRRMKELRHLFAMDGKSRATTDQSFHRLRRSVYGALARSDAAMVSVQMDDIFGEVEAQNIPGTIDEHPNWKRRCAVPVESLAEDDNFNEVEEIMMARYTSGASTGQDGRKK
jgi:4-alpha-glucanotransferase